MKIAVPSRDGQVDNHFGHCAYYEIVEVDDNMQVLSTETMESPSGCGCKSNIASKLHEIGVTVMLAGNIGQGAVDKLAQSQIKVVRGCSGCVKNVVAQYLLGNLVDNAQVCQHHDCHHDEK